MNREIRDNSGQILGRIEDVEGVIDSSTSPPKRDGSFLQKWAKDVFLTRSEKNKYKQVSAKGYRLKQ